MKSGENHDLMKNSHGNHETFSLDSENKINLSYLR